MEEVSRAFQPIQLDGLNGSALLDRFDTKFLVPVSLGTQVLEGLLTHYRILEINGRRMGRYRTVYLDTPELSLYHAHHGGRASRHKIRLRSYLDTGTQYLEVKHRQVGGRMHKTRVPSHGDWRREVPTLDLRSMYTSGSPLSLDRLQEIVRVEYRRITLVARDSAERVTFDVDMRCSDNSSIIGFPHVMVVEIKQARRGSSPALEILRQHRLQPGSTSKYCLAVATLRPNVPSNRFRPTLQRVRQIETDAARRAAD